MTKRKLAKSVVDKVGGELRKDKVVPGTWAVQWLVVLRHIDGNSGYTLRQWEGGRPGLAIDKKTAAWASGRPVRTREVEHSVSAMDQDFYHVRRMAERTGSVELSQGENPQGPSV